MFKQALRSAQNCGIRSLDRYRAARAVTLSRIPLLVTLE